MFNHTVEYIAENNGKKVRVVLDVISKYEHKTRKGLVKFCDNKAFWECYRNNQRFCHVLSVDGNAV